MVYVHVLALSGTWTYILAVPVQGLMQRCRTSGVELVASFQGKARLKPVERYGKKAAKARRQPSCTSASDGQAILALCVAYLLFLYQLPLVPIFAYEVLPQARPHCTSTVCYCMKGQPCPHHHEGGDPHQATAAHHPSHASSSTKAGVAWKTWGAPEMVPFVVLGLDKSLLPATADVVQNGEPPIVTSKPEARPSDAVPPDIFHPPRLI